MQRLKAYFATQYYHLSLVVLPLVMLSIPLGTSAKSIAVILAIMFILCSNQTRANLRLLSCEPIVWVIVGLVGVAILGCLWSGANLPQKFGVVEKYAKLLYIPLFACGFIHKKTRYYGIQAFLIGMLITSFTYFYIYWFIHANSHRGYLADSEYIFYNHIVTGYMMAFAAYLAAWMASQTQTIYSKIGYMSLVFLFSIQMLTMNASRTGYLVYALLLLLFFAQHFSLKSIRYTVVFFVCSLLIVFQQTQSETLIKRVQLISKDLHAYQLGEKQTSVGLRLQFHNYAKSLWLAKPFFGQGTGGFAYHFIQDNPIPGWDPTHPDPHSQYWHTASELGLLGILLLFTVFGMVYQSSCILQEMKPVLQAVLLPFCIVCYSDTVLLTSGIGYVFVTFTGLCLGELLALRQQAITPKTEPTTVNRAEYRLA